MADEARSLKAYGELPDSSEYLRSRLLSLSNLAIAVITTRCKHPL